LGEPGGRERCQGKQSWEWGSVIFRLLLTVNVRSIADGLGGLLFIRLARRFKTVVAGAKMEGRWRKGKMADWVACSDAGRLRIGRS